MKHKSLKFLPSIENAAVVAHSKNNDSGVFHPNRRNRWFDTLTAPRFSQCPTAARRRLRF